MQAAARERTHPRYAAVRPRALLSPPLESELRRIEDEYAPALGDAADETLVLVGSRRDHEIALMYRSEEPESAFIFFTAVKKARQMELLGAETAATAVQAAASDTVLWRARWRCCVLALLISMYV